MDLADCGSDVASWMYQKHPVELGDCWTHENLTSGRGFTGTVILEAAEKWVMFPSECEAVGVIASMPEGMKLAERSANDVVRDDWGIAFYSAKVRGHSDYIMDDGRPHVAIESVSGVRGKVPSWLNTLAGD